MYSSHNLPKLSADKTSQPPTTPNDPEIFATPKSAWLSKFEYDAKTFRLTVFYKNGFISQHLMVYPAEWEALKLAKSVGSHFARNIQRAKSAVAIKKALRPSEFPKRPGGSHGLRNY